MVLYSPTTDVLYLIICHSMCFARPALFPLKSFQAFVSSHFLREEGSRQTLSSSERWKHSESTLDLQTRMTTAKNSINKMDATIFGTTRGVGPQEIPLMVGCWG